MLHKVWFLFAEAFPTGLPHSAQTKPDREWTERHFDAMTKYVENSDRILDREDATLFAQRRVVRTHRLINQADQPAKVLLPERECFAAPLVVNSFRGLRSYFSMNSL